ncbi:tyrosine-type recombinase/integrase [Rhodovulum sulfidophilum]|uniref:tyrosine-type recombinase/integrase n=1 Tax=Rhodovulum sulfidophilum TaxID=35806 RepID=UPI000951D2C4|nr:tyrosine-type recombinase/integrase [Rhodovulum sulfidophilum]OLS48889.1 hypothetical protein BV379_11760 [Rhodovulum sulfidophilum]
MIRLFGRDLTRSSLLGRSWMPDIERALRWGLDQIEAELGENAIAIVQGKTGQRLWVACPADLREYLDALPRTGRFILAKNLTQPLGKRTVQRLVEGVRKKIGATAYVIHGWRYTAAMQLAEAGCSDSEIAAVTGHRTLQMVQKYRAAANQRRLSRQAQDRRGRK